MWRRVYHAPLVQAERTDDGAARFDQALGVDQPAPLSTVSTTPYSVTD